MVKVRYVNSLSCFVDGRRILSLTRTNKSLELLSLHEGSETYWKMTSFKGFNGFILGSYGGKLMLSIDDKLVLIEGATHKVVLKSSKPENFFWHATKAKNSIFVHEYGESPTGIFKSENLENWRKVVENIDLDKRSKHFHYVKYDPYRDWLIATLGDGCLRRVIYSENLGKSWKPLYKGPWQFVPIEVSEDEIVFGMESGIAKGGIGIYYPDDERWTFRFLKWHSGNVRFAQMCDLKRLSNGLWIAALGTPQAIIASKDLETWYPIHVDGFDARFNYHMAISEGEEIVACTTGKSLLLFRKDEPKELDAKTRPVMLSYRAYLDRLKGLGFSFKHRILGS